MANARYCITDEDYGAAVKYLHNRLTDPYRWLERERLDRDAGETAETVANAAYQCKTAHELNAWAETYLSSKQWRNLKMALRNSRRRQRGKIIEVSPDAYDLLKRAQVHTGQTFSELIIAVAEVWEEERELKKEQEQQGRS